MRKKTAIKDVVVSRTVAAYQAGVTAIKDIKEAEGTAFTEKTDRARAKHAEEVNDENQRQSARKEAENARANARSKKLEELKTATDDNAFIDSLAELNSAVEAYETEYEISLSDLEAKRESKVGDYLSTRGSYSEFFNAFEGIEEIEEEQENNDPDVA